MARSRLSSLSRIIESIILSTFFLLHLTTNANGRRFLWSSSERNDNYVRYANEHNGHLLPDIVGNHMYPLLTKIGSLDQTNATEWLQTKGVSLQCSVHLHGWGTNLGQLWSIEMFDAFSKIPEGLLSGHLVSYGDFDECLAVRAQILGHDDYDRVVVSEFKGQHCTANLLTYSDTCVQGEPGESGWSVLSTPSVGICVPSSCAIEDVRNLMLLIYEESSTEVCLKIGHCQTDDKPELKVGDIVMIVILATIGLLCLIGTCIDIFHSTTTKTDNKAVKSITAFSLYTNTKKWLNTSSGSDNLGCLYGIRFISSLWVVLTHAWSAPRPNIWNLTDCYAQFSHWTYPIINGNFSVDTFFTLSGLLLAYTILRKLDKATGKINIPMLYVHRYLRLTPVYALLVGIYATWILYIAPGPYHDTSDVEKCSKYWWRNLLYINNFFQFSDSCVGESWYITVDMQLFLISPFLLVALWKWKRVGLAIMSIFTVASVVVPFAVTYHYELLGSKFISLKTIEYFNMSYIKPWMRLGPYIIGIWGGYLLYEIRAKKISIQLTKQVAAIGWILSTVTALTIIWGPLKQFNVETEYNRLEHAFMAGLLRPLWGLVIVWVIFACSMGFAGVINDFLSAKVFIPLARLTYCNYLIHMHVMQLYRNYMRQAISINVFSLIILYLGFTVLSLFISFVVSMTMESPFVTIENIWLGPGQKTKAKQPEQDGKQI